MTRWGGSLDYDEQQGEELLRITAHSNPDAVRMCFSMMPAASSTASWARALHAFYYGDIARGKLDYGRIAICHLCGVISAELLLE
jgi:hypothetical protein